MPRTLRSYLRLGTLLLLLGVLIWSIQKKPLKHHPKKVTVPSPPPAPIQTTPDKSISYTLLDPDTFNDRPANISAKERIYFINRPFLESTAVPPPPELPSKPKLDMTNIGTREAKEEALHLESKYADKIAEAMEKYTTKYPHMKHARANAAVLILCRNSDRERVLDSLRTFEETFNNKYNYPYIFLNNEPFDEDFKKMMALSTRSKVEFGVIPSQHWSIPDFIDQKALAVRLQELQNKGVMHGGSLSYRFMCRFNSRFFYHHPLLSKYRYYWRVEPGVGFRCKMRYDPLLFMALYKKMYAYNIMAMEYMETVVDLWKTTMEWMKKENIPMNDFLKSLHDPAKNDYNGAHFWSNFEIGDMEFYRSRLYESYMDALDKSGGFFFQRYGDAPVHSIAVSMLLNPKQTHFFADMSYRHDSYYTCPVYDKVKDHYHTLCTCRRVKDWIDDGYWGENHIRYVSNANDQWEKVFHKTPIE